MPSTSVPNIRSLVIFRWSIPTTIIIYVMQHYEEGLCLKVKLTQTIDVSSCLQCTSLSELLHQCVLRLVLPVSTHIFSSRYTRLGTGWGGVGLVKGQLPWRQLPWGQLPWGQLPWGQLPLGQATKDNYHQRRVNGHNQNVNTCLTFLFMKCRNI